jgi:hypothetical protein
MPGTTRLEFYDMSVQDALSILAVDDDALLSSFGVTADAVAELRRAARVVVEQHAQCVALHYTPEPDERAALRVVHDAHEPIRGGFDGRQTRR